MNKIISAVGLCFLIVACTPMPVKQASPIEKIYEVNGFTKDRIFSASNAWIAENFRSSKAVIQDEDKSEGRIIGNGEIMFPCSNGFTCLMQSGWQLYFTMRIDIKDQKMKVTFSNLEYYTPPSGGMSLGGRSPVGDAQMDAVRTALFTLGDELRASIGKEQAKSSW